MKTITCFYSYDRLWPVDALRAWCERRGYRLIELRLWSRWAAAWEAIVAVRRADHVFIWNGQDVGCDWVRRACREEAKPCTFFEWGFFGQKEHFHFDPSGIIGDSSLCGPLDWVTGEMIDRYRAFRAQFLAERGLAWLQEAKHWHDYPEYDDPIVVPLQIEHDSSILFHSPIKRMAELVRRVAEMYPLHMIRIVRHPGNQKQALGELPWNCEVVAGRTLEVAASLHAGLVIGLNSTSLLETALLGFPTRALARCPLNSHEHEPERLLAACLSRQVPKFADDLSPWLRAVGVEL